MEWQEWYEGVVADFVGLTTDRHDPDKLHDWEWMDDYRRAYKVTLYKLFNGQRFGVSL